MRKSSARTAFGLAAFLLGAGAALADGVDDLERGRDAYERDDYRTALVYLTRAIASGDLDRSDLADAYCGRAFVHGELGNDEAALDDADASYDADNSYDCPLY